ncbi:NUDIX hydrolase [Spirosoma sp. KNUC1025]|uniref:NUDIX hydrolase n=1 Tax=Spirosoma sp. KNUC1025 TaxID=2894082 RepID=UPI00386D779A|nr:NUDIX hydrolase [Spirosoma sp. KNUC1025]
MHRQPLLQLLRQHLPADPNEQAMTEVTIAFVEANPDAFERSLLTGHVTGSAWIVSPDRSQVLLIHHRKLDRWLQPGGHADGDPDIAAVALREAQEETGLTSLRLIVPAGSETPLLTPTVPIFDVDVHTIPARNHEPEHLHYDIRFLLEADPNEPFGQSDERKNIRWFTLEIANSYTNSESILRLLRKKV